MHKLMTAALGALAMTVFIGAPALADNPGKHPAYLHALTDLRDARAHLEHLGSDPVDRAEEHAIHQIDEAIGEIKRAAIDDGKDIRDHKAVDTHLVRTDRFHRALELLDKAQQDVSHEEDQPDTRGLQMKIIRHIETARREVRHVIETVLNHS
jgi:hypothetical protein